MIHASSCSMAWSRYCVITTARVGLEPFTLPALEDLNELSGTSASRARNGRRNLDCPRDLAAACGLAEDPEPVECGRGRIARLPAAIVGAQGPSHRSDRRRHLVVYRRMSGTRSQTFNGVACRGSGDYGPRWFA